MSLATAEERHEFPAFLDRETNKELLRFTTAGSVDDGKSTLIGRLLHDSKAVYEDQLAAVKKSRVNRSGKELDLSLLTDGLRAEREQGITIDVAYRYFSTPRRKFIIADTPGHEQYTRNMATGASTADLAVILVDATKGVLAQTRQHAYIASLLGIPNVVGAINKMDLVDYSDSVFAGLQREFRELALSLGIRSIECIPLSALEGDNIVERSTRMRWYGGPTLIEHLETVAIRPELQTAGFRFPVQSVIRPDAGFRGFAGSVAAGSIHRGDPVLALPSRQSSRIKAIVTYDGELEAAVAPQAVVLQLEDEIDLSRGDMLTSPEAAPALSERFAAQVVWLHRESFKTARTYLLKHTSRLVKATAQRIRHRVNINDFREHPAEQLEVNEIGLVDFEASSPLAFDPYQRNRATGSFILIDPLSNATVGAGMIQEPLANDASAEQLEMEHAPKARVTLRERALRNGHLPAIFYVNNLEAAQRIERTLFDHSFQALLVREEEAETRIEDLLTAMLSAGFVVVFLSAKRPEMPRNALESVTPERFFDFSKMESADAQSIEARALASAEALRLECDFHPKGRKK